MPSCINLYYATFYKKCISPQRNTKLIYIIVNKKNHSKPLNTYNCFEKRKYNILRDMCGRNSFIWINVFERNLLICTYQGLNDKKKEVSCWKLELVQVPWVLFFYFWLNMPLHASLRDYVV